MISMDSGLICCSGRWPTTFHKTTVAMETSTTAPTKRRRARFLSNISSSWLDSAMHSSNRVTPDRFHFRYGVE
ncbi:Uncharacterised protein [Chromobacterium violaceum]|uniref:Uncharacterized protein n=1 Tax=Chromobacterium violaceum TaxID=536 RepID=A0AAX2M7K9_CHRVL|nr:Uncharacterised protein [Chromobacterium violaceum]